MKKENEYYKLVEKIKIDLLKDEAFIIALLNKADKIFKLKNSLKIK